MTTLTEPDAALGGSVEVNWCGNWCASCGAGECKVTTLTEPDAALERVETQGSLEVASKKILIESDPAEHGLVVGED